MCVLQTGMGSETKPSKAERTRAAILAAALELFRQQGFAATTMREVAERASVAVGAAYYHFRTKDEILYAFYESLHDRYEEEALLAIDSSRDITTRVQGVVKAKLRVCAGYQELLGQLASHALIPRSELSPFSRSSAPLRRREIAIFQRVIHDSTLASAPSLTPHLPRLLWVYQMAIVSYWINDRSKNRSKTDTLASLSLSLLVRLLSATRLPIVRQANGAILAVLELFAEAPLPANDSDFQEPAQTGSDAA